MAKPETKPTPKPATQYVVRMINGYAIQFIPRGYAVVADDEADLFDSREEADIRARTSGMRWNQFQIEEFHPKERSAR